MRRAEERRNRERKDEERKREIEESTRAGAGQLPPRQVCPDNAARTPFRPPRDSNPSSG